MGSNLTIQHCICTCFYILMASFLKYNVCIIRRKYLFFKSLTLMFTSLHREFGQLSLKNWTNNGNIWLPPQNGCCTSHTYRPPHHLSCVKMNDLSFLFCSSLSFHLFFHPALNFHCCYTLYCACIDPGLHVIESVVSLVVILRWMHSAFCLLYCLKSISDISLCFELLS